VLYFDNNHSKSLRNVANYNICVCEGSGYSKKTLPSKRINKKTNDRLYFKSKLELNSKKVEIELYKKIFICAYIFLFCT